MLSTEELQAIKRRCEKATLGDWGFVPIENHVEYFIFGEDGNEAVAESVYTVDDAEFIANARQDIPKLLAEIERLRGELKTTNGLLSEAHDLMDDVHCYDTDIYHAISNYFNGGDSDD